MLFTMISKNFLAPQEAKSVSVAGGQMVKVIVHDHADLFEVSRPALQVDRW